MDVAKVFTTGRSQAVRLPKEYRFDSEEVGIARLGDMVVLYPRDKAWELFEQGLAEFTEDFMVERRQPPLPEDREKL